MPEETKTKPSPDEKTPEKAQEKEIFGEKFGEKPREEESKEEESKVMTNFANLTSPEGIVMLVIAGIFDFAHIVCAVLIFLFGIGVLAGKIVYIIALIFIGAWTFSRSGTIPIKKKGKDSKLTAIIKKQLEGFLKRHWKKFAAKFIPLIGDLIPFWIITVYKELTSQK